MADTISFESIRNGDIKAIETLFKEFYPSMCAIAIRFVSDKDVAQDIVQEVFIKLWEKRTSYEEIPNLKTFLYVSIKNLCFNYLRDKKETIDYTNQEVINREYHFKNRLIEEETYRIVSHAIDSLPPQSSKIIKMCLEGKQNKEIAEILGISVNSVKTLKYNALSTLKEVLKDHFYILIILLLGEKI